MPHTDRLKNLILYILKFSKEEGIPNLSTYQLYKLIYLIEIESRKYTGEAFIKDLKFMRMDRGPIIIGLPDLIKELSDKVEVRVDDIPNRDIKRHSHFLKNNVDISIEFTNSEQLFLNSVLLDYMPLNLLDLKKIVYATKPMKLIVDKEKGILERGLTVALDEVLPDEDLLSIINGEVNE